MYLLILLTLSASGSVQSAKYVAGPFAYQAECGRVIKTRRAMRAKDKTLICTTKSDSFWPKVTISGLPNS